VYDRQVDLVWDLMRARFASSGSSEPSSGYFIDVLVDDEMVGDTSWLVRGFPHRRA
jgi:hypothetical protein